MEFEFDKEMDSLMRQAAKGEGLFGKPTPTEHIDADEISMFAENALPEKARPPVIKHLADCDRCRTILSNLIALNAEAETATAVVPVTETKAATVVASTEPTWWQKLFSTRNLAFGMGALAIIFAIGVGFIVVRNISNSGYSEMAKIDNSAASDTQAPAELNEANTDSSNANSADINTGEDDAKKDSADSADDEADNQPNKSAEDQANRTTDKKESVPMTTTDADVQVAKNKPTTLGQSSEKSDKSPTPGIITEEADEVELKDNTKLDDRESNVAKTESKPPSPVTARGGVTRSKEAAKKRRDSGAGAANKGVSKPSSTRRQIGQKTFILKNELWVDSVYKGQSTTIVKRGTSQYRDLEPGLRSFTDNLRGQVIVVWKSKAYKIQ
jgi:hypothetical protein